MTAVIEQATPADIADLRQLYYAVYGPHYPTALGTDPAEMSRLIRDPHTLWLVARCPRTGTLAGSAAVHSESGSRVGRLEGLAVHPDQRGSGLAGQLTEAVCAGTLDAGTLDSVYATVRTVSAGPQRVVARNGFRPWASCPTPWNSAAARASHSTRVTRPECWTAGYPSPRCPPPSCRSCAPPGRASASATRTPGPRRPGPRPPGRPRGRWR